MEIIIHRVNSISQLKKIPCNYGVEIDLRLYNKKIILNHDPKKNGVLFDSFLKNYNHGTLVLNIKETGIENEVIKKVKKKGLKNFFLLDVEIPYIFKCIKTKKKTFALRCSYYEPIIALKKYKNLYSWLWLDSIKKIRFSNSDLQLLRKFKICFVCPSHFNRPSEIDYYKKYFKKKLIKLDAVMTSKAYANDWM